MGKRTVLYTHQQISNSGIIDLNGLVSVKVTKLFITNFRTESGSNPPLNEFLMLNITQNEFFNSSYICDNTDSNGGTPPKHALRLGSFWVKNFEQLPINVSGFETIHFDEKSVVEKKEEHKMKNHKFFLSQIDHSIIHFWGMVELLLEYED